VHNAVTINADDKIRQQVHDLSMLLETLVCPGHVLHVLLLPRSRCASGLAIRGAFQALLLLLFVLFFQHQLCVLVVRLRFGQ
jgi:hypothetical protein